jgi:hypothetical protein
MAHVHPQTARALNERAKGAIPSLTKWVKFLGSALAAQSPQPLKRTGFRIFEPDPPLPETITLRRDDLLNLIYDLDAHAKELRKYTT